MIEVKAKTIEQFVDEVLISAIEYCARARSILLELFFLSDCFSKIEKG